MDLRFELVDGTSSGVLVEGNELAGWQTKIRVALVAAHEPLTTAELMKRCLVERGGPGHSSFKKGSGAAAGDPRGDWPARQAPARRGAVVSLAGDAGNRVPNRVPSFFAAWAAGASWATVWSRAGPALGHRWATTSLHRPWLGYPPPL